MLKKLTTNSGRVYLVDESARRFKRLSGRPNPYVSEGMNDTWLPLHDGSRYEVGSSAILVYDDERPSQYLLTTPVVSIEETEEEQEA